MVTIKDIAKQLGVSVSTVSRALNNHPDININTKKKVLKAFEDHQYTPNVLARTLTKQKSYTIGLLLPNITGDFYSSIAQVIEHQLSKVGYHTLYGLFNDTEEKERKNLIGMVERKVDGIIASPNFVSKDTIDLLKRSRIPTVFLRRRPPENSLISFVDVDYFSGAQKAVDYLISLGHREIGFIGLPDFSFAGKERFKGYLEAINTHNLSPYHIFSTKKDIENGSRTAQELLEKHPFLTAIFVAHDILAVGALEYFAINNIKVPNDISIIGFGDLNIANLYWTKLTTIAQPIERMGKEITEILLSSLQKNNTDNQKLLIKTKLIVRESCAQLYN